MESGYEIIKRLRKGEIIKCADCKKADENIIRMHRQSRDSEGSHKNNKENANGFRQNNI